MRGKIDRATEVTALSTNRVYYSYQDDALLLLTEPVTADLAEVMFKSLHFGEPTPFRLRKRQRNLNVRVAHPFDLDSFPDKRVLHKHRRVRVFLTGRKRNIVSGLGIVVALDDQKFYVVTDKKLPGNPLRVEILTPVEEAALLFTEDADDSASGC